MRRFRLSSVREVREATPHHGRIECLEVVATGVVWHDKTVAMRWLGESPSTAVYADLDTFRKIHHVIPHPDDGDGERATGAVSSERACGRVGDRYIIWEDPICFACGSVLFYGERVARHCYSCGAGQSEAGFFGDAPDPSLGRWVPAVVFEGAQPESDP